MFVHMHVHSPDEKLQAEAEREPTDAQLARLATVLEEALRAEVQFNRIKKHYHEVYAYQSSMTPDATDTARRASTWMFLYLWWRGLFEVQYEGMSVEEKAAAVRARGEGYAGGMPDGSKIKATAALERWWGGHERAYVDAVAAFTESDVGSTLVISGKYAAHVSVASRQRVVQWRGGESDRPSVPKDGSRKFTLVSVANGNVTLCEVTGEPTALTTETAATEVVVMETETTVETTVQVAMEETVVTQAEMEVAMETETEVQVATTETLVGAEVMITEASGMVAMDEAAMETMVFPMPTCDVRVEPLFVRLDARTGNFLPEEMHMETVGRTFAELGDDLGFRPYASGLNSVRRNGMVAVSKGCDDTGRDMTTAKKAANHRGRSGTMVLETVYDDATSSTDMGAIMMGRRVKRIESLRTLATTRLPALAKVRTFGDVAANDLVRQRIFENEPKRLKLRQMWTAAKEVERKLRLEANEARAAANTQGSNEQRQVARDRLQEADQAKAIVEKRRRKLDNLEAKLRSHVVKTKRWEMWEDHMSKWDKVSQATVTSRIALKDESKTTLSSLVAQLSTAQASREAAAQARLGGRPRHKQVRRDGAGQVLRKRRGGLVCASVSVGSDGEVKLELRPTEDRRASVKKQQSRRSTPQPRKRQGKLVAVKCSVDGGGMVVVNLKPTADKRKAAVEARRSEQDDSARATARRRLDMQSAHSPALAAQRRHCAEPFAMEVEAREQTPEDGDAIWVAAMPLAQASMGAGAPC